MVLWYYSHLLSTHFHLKMSDYTVCSGLFWRGRNTIKVAWWSHWFHSNRHHNFAGKCDLCELSFDKLEEMREHHKEAHDGKSCICAKCNLPQKRCLLPAYHNPCKKEYKVERIKDEDGNYLDEASPPKPRQRLTDRPTMKTREHLHSHYLKEGEDPMNFRTFTSHLVLTKDNGKEDF